VLLVQQVQQALKDFLEMMVQLEQLAFKAQQEMMELQVQPVHKALLD
jgi:hypothetical protein